VVLWGGVRREGRRKKGERNQAVILSEAKDPALQQIVILSEAKELPREEAKI
jgi:hypothetical protein